MSGTKLLLNPKFDLVAEVAESGEAGEKCRITHRASLTLNILPPEISDKLHFVTSFVLPLVLEDVSA